MESVVISIIHSDDQSHSLLTDGEGNQALFTGNKLIFIGVGKDGKACFRDIHDFSGITELSEMVVHCDLLESLNEFVKNQTVADDPESYVLTRTRAYNAMTNGHRIKHKHFSDHEYLYMIQGHRIVTETGTPFDDWWYDVLGVNSWKLYGWKVL